MPTTATSCARSHWPIRQRTSPCLLAALRSLASGSCRPQRGELSGRPAGGSTLDASVLLGRGPAALAGAACRRFTPRGGCLRRGPADGRSAPRWGKCVPKWRCSTRRAYPCCCRASGLTVTVSTSCGGVWRRRQAGWSGRPPARNHPGGGSAWSAGLCRRDWLGRGHLVSVGQTIAPSPSRAAKAVR